MILGLTLRNLYLEVETEMTLIIRVLYFFPGHCKSVTHAQLSCAGILESDGQIGGPRPIWRVECFCAANSGHDPTRSFQRVAFRGIEIIEPFGIKASWISAAKDALKVFDRQGDGYIMVKAGTKSIIRGLACVVHFYHALQVLVEEFLIFTLCHWRIPPCSSWTSPLCLVDWRSVDIHC